MTLNAYLGTIVCAPKPSKVSIILYPSYLPVLLKPLNDQRTLRNYEWWSTVTFFTVQLFQEIVTPASSWVTSDCPITTSGQKLFFKREE